MKDPGGNKKRTLRDALLLAGREGFEYHPLYEGPGWNKKTHPHGRALSGGKGGIRTLGGHEAHNGFRDRPIQPLWHLPKYFLAGGIIS